MTRSVLVDREPSLAVRSYRGLLPLLPQDFRHAYGADVVETFRGSGGRPVGPTAYRRARAHESDYQRSAPGRS